MVTVRVPARLHLGFLDLNGGLGRRFGSIGLALGNFKTILSIRRAKHTDISGPESERVRPCVLTMERALGQDGAHAVSVLQTVPPHAGLGSGTQLALAVASGMRRLYNLPLEIEEDALRLARGVRSGIVIFLMKQRPPIVNLFPDTPRK